MSFWDFALKLAPTVIAAGATIYGAKQASEANDKAAQTASKAQAGATAAELEAIKVAEGTMRQQQQQASPGLMRIQDVIGRSEALTPEQQIALNDARRTTVDTLAGGGLRGSARATVAAVRDVEGRMQGDMVAANRQRADQAASNLSGQYFNAGNNVANLNLATGKSVSAGLINTGDINAANTMGQANIKGQAIGDIGAVIADQIKSSQQEARDSSYQPINAEDIKWNGTRQGMI